jgi:putative ABC transport system substrate-binding protein
MRLVGVLMGVTAENPVTEVRLAAFRDGLANLGWSEGRNVSIEYRWAGADVERLKSTAADLAALAPEVIVSGGTEATAALKGVTQTLPIVFVHVADPVSGGLVQSLTRVGGNITGFTAHESLIGGKWLQLLKEIAPRVNHVLVLAGENPTWRMHAPTIQSAFNVQLTITHLHSATAIEPSR